MATLVIPNKNVAKKGLKLSIETLATCVKFEVKLTKIDKKNR